MKFTRLALPLGLGLLAAGAGLLISHRARSQSEAWAPMRPFTAMMIEKHFSEDGKLAPLPDGINYTTVARKSNGSQVRFLPLRDPDGSFALLRDIFDVAGRRVGVYPATKSVTTDYIAPIHVGHEIARSESCPPEASNPAAERSQRLGYEVVRVHEENPGSFETETYDRWVAPALGCFPLEETETSSLGARNETQVINIFEGEPPDSWFTIPSGYTERSPSEHARAYAARFPGHRYASDEALALMDRRYYAHRSPQK